MVVDVLNRLAMLPVVSLSAFGTDKIMPVVVADAETRIVGAESALLSINIEPPSLVLEIYKPKKDAFWIKVDTMQFEAAAPVLASLERLRGEGSEPLLE